MCMCGLQTKNVAGRLLVGLRWWNEVTDEGSNWRFETLEEVGPSARTQCCCDVFVQHCTLQCNRSD